VTREPDVRRVRIAEWRELRDLRIEAVGDPTASIAFLTTADEERARDESFWRERAAGAAIGAYAAQFIADGDGGDVLELDRRRDRHAARPPLSVTLR